VPAGRPSLYSDELADDICDLIANGRSLRSICTADDMPSRRTVLRWLSENPDFAAKHARAREAQADVMDEKILEVADACTNETAAADRVKIGAYQWRAARLAPKRYGDKIQAEVGGPDGAPLIPPMDPVEAKLHAAKAVAFMLSEAAQLMKAKDEG
jgi:hypothetical protein